MADQQAKSIIQDFIKTYDQFSDKIFRHLFFRIRDREKALDLMQETFTKTFLYIKDGKEVENIQAFLYRVANNLMIDDFKKRKVYSLEKMEEEDGFTPSIDETAMIQKKIDAETVLQKIGEVPSAFQTVIVMRYVDELSSKEIAAILGESENSINVKMHRGLKKLRKILEGHE